MMNVTVPGGAYSGDRMLASPELALIAAIEIASALELEAYAEMRKAYHRHERTNNATSAADYDKTVMGWHDAVASRDAAEQRRAGKAR